MTDRYTCIKLRPQPTMGRTSDARERLMEAAFGLIWTNSYGAVGVDQICERAGVGKGSFYHFFPSKADLALATFDDQWTRRRPELDAMFSPVVPPLERIDRWCGFIRSLQQAMAARFGQVCGCPFVNVASELGTQDARLRSKMAEFFARAQRYLRSALRDAMDTGMIAPEDPDRLARMLHALALGYQVHAKVENDTTRLDELSAAARRLLGVPEAVPACVDTR